MIKNQEPLSMIESLELMKKSLDLLSKYRKEKFKTPESSKISENLSCFR